jgi:hypothetical protein
MISMAIELIQLAQWLIFFAMLAVIVLVTMRIARWRGLDQQKQRKYGLVAGSAAFVLLNIPNILAIGGKNYAEHICSSEMGEFIYKTVEDVQGLYQIRPTELTRYGHFSGYMDWENDTPEYAFVRPGQYSFFEVPASGRYVPGSNQKSRDVELSATSTPTDKYLRFFGYNGELMATMSSDLETTLASRYGYVHRDVTQRLDRMLGIQRIETEVMELQTSEILARRRWILFSGMVLCPVTRNEYFTVSFVQKVLRPASASDQK